MVRQPQLYPNATEIALRCGNQQREQTTNVSYARLSLLVMIVPAAICSIQYPTGLFISAAICSALASLVMPSLFMGEYLARETWEQIIDCLFTSPACRANGIACASRVLNARWRAMHRTVVQNNVTCLSAQTRIYCPDDRGYAHLPVLFL